MEGGREGGRERARARREGGREEYKSTFVLEVVAGSASADAALTQRGLVRQRFSYAERGSGLSVLLSSNAPSSTFLKK